MVLALANEAGRAFKPGNPRSDAVHVDMLSTVELLTTRSAGMTHVRLTIRMARTKCAVSKRELNPVLRQRNHTVVGFILYSPQGLVHAKGFPHLMPP